MSITMISMIDMAFGIGDVDGNLLFGIPEALEHVEEGINGKTIVAGRKTWETLSDKVRDGNTYVLTRDESFDSDGANKLHSIKEVLELSKKEDIVILGGGEVYEQMMKHTDSLFIIHIHTIGLGARTFFPNIEFEEWRITDTKRVESAIPPFAVTKYTRR